MRHAPAIPHHAHPTLTLIGAGVLKGLAWFALFAAGLIIGAF